ncbi:hypothetical protein ACFQ2B_28325 [Streptomyces stramineus]
MSSRNLPFALVLAYLGVVVAVDLVTAANLRLDVFAALAPLTAAVLCTYRQTVFVGILDFCLMVAHHAVLTSDVAVNRVGSFVGNALMVGASIAVAWLRRDGDALLERVRATGEAAQRRCCGRCRCGRAAWWWTVSTCPRSGRRWSAATSTRSSTRRTGRGC